MNRLSFFQRLLRVSINRSLLGAIRDRIDRCIRKISIRLVGLTTKIDPQKVVFLNFSGMYDCNPKAIAQEFIDRKASVSLYWGIFSPEQAICGDFPQDIGTFIRKTYDCYKHLASAKIIIDNGVSLATLNYKKKKDQVLVETWHGAIGIKKFGRAGNNDVSWHKRADREGKMTDYIISNSTFETKVYRSEFWKDTKVLEFGHPRNDLFFCRDFERIERIQRKIKKKYDIGFEKKMCLYAPTFRDGDTLSAYEIDTDRLIEALEKRFGNNCDEQTILLCVFPCSADSSTNF